ncbi:hypothetical protein DPX16_1672 [Anabarilius grahami]|uniref:Uncharacterized protein n=1 Tax=Anabarilius grahami TaxID=495550 RepID=A0A3N0Y2P5_ANAGA|nr:hypothetical protein DPX16_1672 [Anabarilius grahami]
MKWSGSLQRQQAGPDLPAALVAENGLHSSRSDEITFSRLSQQSLSLSHAPASPGVLSCLHANYWNEKQQHSLCTRCARVLNCHGRQARVSSFHGMRSAVLLLLLVTLMITDGWEEFPCESVNDNNAYYSFQHKHILPSNFDTNSQSAWESYLKENGLCGRASRQSFLRKKDEDRVQGICHERGVRYSGNMCISTRLLKVYIVESYYDSNRKCRAHVRSRYSYVVVACDVAGNQCLPVHYHGQTTSRPSGNVPCAPRAYF